MTKQEIEKELELGAICIWKSVTTGSYYFGKAHRIHGSSTGVNTIITSDFNEFWEKVKQELGAD
jgi:ribosomal protein L35AE/L33A